MERKPGELYLGNLVVDGQRTDEPLTYDATDLTTHGVIVGMTGSGKTGLGIVLLEEALLAGRPGARHRPQGRHAATCCSRSPTSRPADFAPVGRRVRRAARGPRPPRRRRGGHALDGGPGRVGASARRASRRCATRPTSRSTRRDPTAGVPLDIIGNLRAAARWRADAERCTTRSTASSSGCSASSASRPTRCAGREHILLANLVDRAWAPGATSTSRR